MKEQDRHDAVIRAVLSAQAADGRLRSREGTTIEFKETFGFKSLPEYARSMAAFSNHQGGYIIFGVTNAPRFPRGINRDNFDALDPAKLSTGLNELFDPAIHWELGIVEFDGKSFGFIYTHKHSSRPVICRKTVGKELKAGEIYYRYHGQTKVIGFPELRAMLDEVRENERKLWMKHIESIARIGPTNLAFLDLAKGDISGLSSAPQLLVERGLLDEMRKRFVMVEEGRFTEKDGAPALRLEGSLIPADTVISPDLNPEKNYPFILTGLAAEVGITQYQAQALIWELNLKSDGRFSAPVKYGKKASTTKYSNAAVRLLRQTIDTQANRDAFLAEVSKRFIARAQNQKKKKRK